ncbi:MAG: type II 3-dehydroquinate dehydratase [Bacilli bacterium]|nr:type II 3-dehydroquinate dehydratase [Bacilli bacterium]
MKLLVLNGPNLNFIGIREPNIYGKETYNDLCNFLNECVKDKNVELEIKQSNHEGELVDFIQQAYYDKVDGIIINPGAYTHTSIALLDAVKSVNIKTIEVHLSDVTKREDFRQVSYIRMACVKSIMGKGFLGYKEAIEYFLNN